MTTAKEEVEDLTFESEPIEEISTVHSVNGEVRLTEIRVRIIDVYTQASSLHPRDFEKLSGEELRRQFCTPALQILEQSLKIAKDTLSLCDSGEPLSTRSQASREFASSHFERGMDEIVASEATCERREHAADIAFVARTELFSLFQQLSGQPRTLSNRQMLIDHEGAIRRSKKSIAAIEHALAPLADEPPTLTYDSELQISLRVREAYSWLASGLRESEPVEERRIHAALRAAGTRIAMLIGKEVYSEMRMEDRFLLLDIQDRLLKWMGEAQNDTRGGVRLWQDIVASYQMLRQISRRSVLREHDEQQLTKLSKALAAEGQPDLEQALEQARSLAGLDEWLDQVLDGGDARQRDELQAVVEHLLQATRPQTATGTDPFA